MPLPRRQEHYAMVLSYIYLSVAYIGHKSRTERPRKTKIGTQVAHVMWLWHHFQGQKVKGQGHRGRGNIVAGSRTAYAPAP